MPELDSLVAKLTPFMTERLQNADECFVITAAQDDTKDMATLLLFR